ncbi:cytidylate kinase-like family protein [Peptoniphilus mikwangii]|uniref:cytidylate kinase-like family protein n=1 Tax=Peptoniphilus mikwangii TaxID=1354300 RepID=UPI0004187334|nr:cytidylate kinase-like family protein [Peptoniphilus mikwangii]
MSETNFLRKIFSASFASKKNLIITIDREHGSGGFEISKIIGKLLNIEVYDEDIIELKTLEGKVDPDNIKKDDSFLQGTIYDLYRENYSYSQEDITNIDASFLANSKTIRDFAKKGSCIILGKCANYVLKDNYDIFSVFITADKEYRIERIMQKYNIDREKAIYTMNKKDTRRKNHYNKFTNGSWGNAFEYDLTINSSKFSNEDVAKIIIKSSELKK